MKSSAYGLVGLVPALSGDEGFPRMTMNSRLDALVGQVVVADLAAPYVCLGTLAGFDDAILEFHDADLHDFRDSQATRELYVFESARLGIRRNRARVLVQRGQVVALALLADVLES